MEVQDKKILLYIQAQKIRYHILTRVLTLWNGYAHIHLRFNVIQLTFQQNLAQQILICLLYLKKHEHMFLPILFFPKIFVLVKTLEYLSTIYVLGLEVVFLIEI